MASGFKARPSRVIFIESGGGAGVRLKRHEEAIVA